MGLTLGTNTVVIKEGQILVTKRSDIPIWCLPGGIVEPNESLTESAMREVQEETGVEVIIERLVGMYSRPNWFDGDHVAVFIARPRSIHLIAQPEEVVDLKFVDPANLPNPFVWWHRQRIEDALTQNPVSAVVQNVVWPGQHKTREQVYQNRDTLDPIQLANFFARPSTD